MSILADILKTAALRLSIIHPDNGFAFEVHKIHLPIQDGEEYTPEHLSIIVTADEDSIERETELDRPGNPPAIAFVLPILIECVIIPSNHNCETFDTFASTIYSNMASAITIWPDWHQFDRRCLNSEVGRPVYKPPTDDGGIGSVQFTILATYRVDETNLENLRG